MSSFVDALETLAAQSKAQMRMSFLEVETAIKSKLSHLMERLNERRSRREATITFGDDCCEAKPEEKDVSTQFLQIQKRQLIELQDHFERYCYVLPVLDSTAGNMTLT